MVKALLGAGANIEAWTKDGWTPLQYAARYSNSVDVVKAFLAAGANPKGNRPNTPEPVDLIQQNDALRGSDAYWLFLEKSF